METCTSQMNNEAVLSFVLRVILGILFFFQGYDKVFKVKVSGVNNVFRQELGNIQLPGFILSVAAWFTSYTELICGGLLIIGLFKSYALWILGIDLILVTAAFSLIKPVWDMNLVFPRLILLAILLYLPVELDIISIDHLLLK
jgi:putative oxidoreductase